MTRWRISGIVAMLIVLFASQLRGGSKHEIGQDEICQRTRSMVKAFGDDDVTVEKLLKVRTAMLKYQASIIRHENEDPKDFQKVNEAIGEYIGAISDLNKHIAQLQSVLMIRTVFCEH